MPEKNQKSNKSTRYYLIIGIIILGVTILWLFFAFKTKPLTYNDMFKKAEMYAKQGQVAFALEEYKRLLSLYPENYEVHLGLGELYEKVNEPDKAKIEYVMAIRQGGRHKPKAYLKLAKIYCNESRYRIAEDIISDIKDTKNKDARKAIGDMYFNWGEHLKNTDKPEAIRKYKKAREYYQETDTTSEKNTAIVITNLYAEISNDLINSKKIKEAVEILKLSLKYEDTALAHYKLARIYESNGKDDKALKEYSNALKLDPEITNKSSYIKLLVKKAKEFKDKGNDVNAEYYYSKAKKLNSALDVPLNPDKKILFTLIATKLNEDADNDILVPGIIFKVINISKDIIDDLKIKVVFLKDGKPVSSEIVTIASKESPFKGDSESSEIGMYSNAPIKHVFDDHDLVVQVYVSQKSPKKWKLFRNIPITRERKPITIVD